MSPEYSALEPVSDAVVEALARDGVIASLASGGVSTSIPAKPALPYIFVEVQQDGDEDSYGSQPGRGAAPVMSLLPHVYGDANGSLRDTQRLAARVIAVLASPPVIEGYDAVAIFHEGTTQLEDQVLRGVPVFEIVPQFRLELEEA